jgi:lysophospholipase L1-like esterase
MRQSIRALLLAAFSAILWANGIAFVRAAAVPDYTDASRTIQFEAKPVLNARAVTTLANGKLITWNKGIDGTWSGLATRLAADAMGSAGKVALPDDGVFPGNPFHPMVKLNFSNDDPTGNQVRYTDRNASDSYSLDIAEDFYSNLSLFFMSAFGASEINVEISYDDKTTELKHYLVEDWATRISENETKYLLSANLAKWGPRNTELEKDHHYLMGINLKPASTRKVARVTILKPASATSLTFWGATGYRIRPAPKILPGNAPEISYEGRTWVTAEGTVRLAYPGIVVRVNFRGTALNLHARTAGSELYLDVGIDGAGPRFMQVPKGESDLALAQDLPAGEHQAVIWKRVESLVGILDVMSFAVAGDFLPSAPLPQRRLMFLGDSFAAGQATAVEDGGPIDPSKAKRQNARLAFGRLLSDRLQAQCHIIAYAGRGVMRDWQGVRAVRCAPEYYEYALPDDISTHWDPKAYVPDAIGVCLGNNDFSEGVPDQTEYIRLYAEFVRKLRRDAPDAYIFLILSPSLTDEPGQVPMHSVQRAYLEEIARRLGDSRVQVVPIAHYPAVPGDGHPSGTAHRAVADELEPVFRKALKW